jgi:hypothetical protein
MGILPMTARRPFSVKIASNDISYLTTIGTILDQAIMRDMDFPECTP